MGQRGRAGSLFSLALFWIAWIWLMAFSTIAAAAIATQAATTQVLVPDGGTVIFGGVSIHTTTNTANYVPLLGQIPILGNLFKLTDKKTHDDELVFFVTPKILPG